MTIEITANGPECRFTFRRCETCNTQQWFIDDSPAPLTTVLDEFRLWAGTRRVSDLHRLGGTRTPVAA